jgi:hypothetical protein
LGFSWRMKKTWLREEEVDNKVGGWRARDRETSPFKDKRHRIEAELAREECARQAWINFSAYRRPTFASAEQ